MKKIKFILKFIKYYLLSKGKKSIHSPFVFHLFTNIILNKNFVADYNKVETIRKELIHNKKTINVTDFGANSSNLFSTKSIKYITKNSAKQAKYAQLLYGLAKHFNPNTLLELGTSFGISTMYQALAVPESKIITIEGCPQTASVAKDNFKKLNLNNIELLTGNFDIVLPQILKNVQQLDYVFFDGNHKKNATLNYFEQCLPLIHNDTVFIFDDIHWSEEMEDAWENIKKYQQVIVTIDLFFMGLVFFKKELSKQNFIIRF